MQGYVGSRAADEPGQDGHEGPDAPRSTAAPEKEAKTRWTSPLAGVCSSYPMRDRSGRRRKVDIASDGEAQQTFVSSFGEAIRRGRLARGWTQAALADASQLSANYVAHRIAQALGIEIDALVATEEAAPPVPRIRRRVG